MAASNDDESVESDGQDLGIGDRSQPRNMQGLLRLAIQNTDTEPVQVGTEDGSSSRFQALDENRRRWLEQVLSSMSVNVAAVMKQAIDTLTLPEPDEAVSGGGGGGSVEESLLVVEKKLQALDELMEWVDNIDFANDFQKIGGFAILRPCLQSGNGEIRYRTAELIAELVQNNPHCQQAATDTQLVRDLTRLLDVDACDTVRVKALYALSGILRDQPTAQKAFADCDGYSVLLRAMQSNIDKLKVKASFLLSALCTEQPALKDDLCNMGFVEQLVALIQCEHDLTHEHLLGALNALVCDNESAIRECRRPEFNFRQTLVDRQDFVRGKEEFKEEYEHCQKLANTCFGAVDQEDR